MKCLGVYPRSFEDPQIPVPHVIHKAKKKPPNHERFGGWLAHGRPLKGCAGPSRRPVSPNTHCDSSVAGPPGPASVALLRE